MLNHRLIPLGVSPFKKFRFSDKASIALNVENHSLPIRYESKDLPNLIIFSSGEVYPFQIEIRPLASAQQMWLLSSDGISQTKIDYSEI